MNALFALATAVFFLAAPAAFAHEPGGTPKNYCEPPSEWSVHDYNADPPQVGLHPFTTIITDDRPKYPALFQDGNLLGDCNGDGVPADFDGHREFGFAAFALLSADSGDGATGGSVACWGEAAHHPVHGIITTEDIPFDLSVVFSVSVDEINLVPPTDPSEPDCGDLFADRTLFCVNTCAPTFPPGRDGAYVVQVGDPTRGSVSALGHVYA